MIRVLLDHTCIQALAEGDEFLNGLYVEASYGYVEIVIPALSATVAEREKSGAGQHILSRRFTTVVDFTHAHALLAGAWRQADWRILPLAASALVGQQACLRCVRRRASLNTQAEDPFGSLPAVCAPSVPCTPCVPAIKCSCRR